MDGKTLEAIPLFATLSKHDREKVAHHADDIDVAAGTHLLDQGRLPHEFFVLLEGTVEVRKDGEHLADLGPGDFFGEIALVEHEPRTASVIATTPCRAVVMGSREFEAIRQEVPSVAAQIHEAIRERMTRG